MKAAVLLLWCSLALTSPLFAQGSGTPAKTTDISWSLDLNHAAQGVYERGEDAFVVGQPKAGTSEAAPRLSLWSYRDEKLAELVASSPDEQGKVRWKLPTARRGYFEVRPSNAAQSWPVLGSRPAGKLTFAVVEKVDSNPSRDFKYNFLALQGSVPALTQEGGDVYSYLGLQSQAIDYGWPRFETKPLAPGDPDSYAKMMAEDKAPADMRAAKRWPYFYISRIPRWSVAPDHLSDEEKKNLSIRTSLYPPQNWSQYENYLSRVVPYIAKSYSYLPYRIYEVQWEPVMPWGWHGTPEELVKMFEVAHRVVHQYDPQGFVAGPTLSSLNQTSDYETLLRLGLGHFIDVLGMHTYNSYPPENANIPEQLAKFRALTKKYVGHDLPIVGTENAYPEARTGGATN